MKMILIPLLTVSTLFPTSADTIDSRRHISVEATSEILAEPDHVSFSVEIRGEGGSLEAAADQLRDATDRMTSHIEEAFDGDLVRLGSISSARHYKDLKNLRAITGYSATRKAVITLHELGQRQKLELILLNDDRVTIENATPRSSKHDALRLEAIVAAGKKAREKAEVLAGSLSATIGAVLSIETRNERSGWLSLEIAPNISTGTERSEPESSDLEKLSFSATATVKFALDS